MMEERRYEEEALAALRRAVADALDRKRRLGQYAVVWRDGRPHFIGPDAPDSAGRYGEKESTASSAVRESDPMGDGESEKS